MRTSFTSTWDKLENFNLQILWLVSFVPLACFCNVVQLNSYLFAFPTHSLGEGAGCIWQLEVRKKLYMFTARLLQLSRINWKNTTCLRFCSLICVQCPHHFWRKVVTMVTPHAFASDHSNHYSRSSWKLQNHAAGAMEDATFFHCNNAIEDPILWVKGSTCCDGVAAFWTTMRLLCCLAMLSASSISKWNTVWSSMQWIQWRSGRFKVFAALMKPATVSWMHWLTWFESRRFTFARQHVNVSWDLGLMHPCLAVPVREAEGHEARPS